MAFDLTGCPDVLTPRLRIFLSADVVGSTALKQPVFLETQIDWLEIMQRFYGEMVDAMETGWEQLKSDLDEELHDVFLGPPPQFWKTVGDEVLYYKDLTDSRQITLTILCWKRALGLVRTYFEKQNKGLLQEVGLTLDLKSTIWTAGFPRRNKTIVSPAGLSRQLRGGNYSDAFRRAQSRALSQQKRDANARVEFDFIGPGIDIGFRLANFATEQKMVISLDVAYILALRGTNILRRHMKTISVDPIPIHYDGRVLLKGVFGQRKYPLFWIDNSPAGSFEAAEVAARTPIQDAAVLKFAQTFYTEHYREFTHEPFIINDPANALTSYPPEFAQWMEVQIKLYKDLAREEALLRRKAKSALAASEEDSIPQKQIASEDVTKLARKLTTGIPAASSRR
ncbi:hypothetical protein SAMN05428974_1338 [Sphingopyxis sp. YR583]|uniref:hypothetical protein n=1 Tax=Sphingopyxis sp. YR583 TaxID=1881047 RepID=UPI0008A78D7E|nr:hypothetical protein [Sphingopyxis sp. YR583]SEH15046.1 hypothetical protein SAMN05428974_1338 [Sphingopyxis sp. YR583]